MDRLSLYLIICAAVCCDVIFAKKNSTCGESCSCLNRGCLTCDNDEMEIDLNAGIVPNIINDVIVWPPQAPPPGTPGCGYGIRLQATFKSPLATECRNLLKVTMEFANDREGYLFNFGDSLTNDGGGGDANTQYNDAEIEAVNDTVRVWGSDRCQPNISLVEHVSALKKVDTVTVWIGNEHYKITAGKNLDDELCHECLFALDGQVDSQGPINQDVYLAFNGVVSGAPDRRGYGICKARISWHCPCEILSV